MTYPTNLGRHGQLVPVRGFSRWRAFHLPEHHSAWLSADGLRVISSLDVATLPGSDGLTGPTWVVSLSRQSGRDRRPTIEDVVRVADAFQMPAYDEDNHGPGISRTLFCPVDPRYRTACECKTDETLIVEADGYAWTTPTDGPCTGCYYETLFDLPCPIHHPE